MKISRLIWKRLQASFSTRAHQTAPSPVCPGGFPATLSAVSPHVGPPSELLWGLEKGCQPRWHIWEMPKVEKRKKEGRFA